MAFSNSIQPRKQRKARYNAPLHERQKLVHAHVSKEARAKAQTSKRSTAVRAGDRVKVMRGSFSGKSGKVSEVDLASLKVYVEGMTVRKAKGREALVALEPSNLVIMELDVSDKRRKEALARKGGVPRGASAPAGAR